MAGAIEDPLANEDFEGYKQLRLRSRIPIYFHHLPLQGREALFGLADGYMMGHSPIGKLIQRAGLFEAANVPFMIQNTGGNVTRAFVVHMASVFPTATLHHVTATDLWAEDVVAPALRVEGGTVAVPEGPGARRHPRPRRPRSLEAGQTRPVPACLGAPAVRRDTGLLREGAHR